MKKIKVHVNSSKEEIKRLGEDNYEVWLKQKAIDGKANLELIKVLSKHFGKPVKIKSGFTSRKKIVEIED